jgi:phospholipid/cholesterol/gamma-HCH transport system substrate-binding protein
MNSDRKTELLVGMFLLAGLIFGGLVVIKFGKFRDYFQGSYTKKVQFADATGIRIGSPVLLGGQRVGKVKTEPVLNPPTFESVTVELEIFSSFPVPEKVSYQIATSGLLGDGYIAIRPGTTAPQTLMQADGTEVLLGTKDDVIGELTATAKSISGDADKVLKDVDDAAKELKDALHRINTGALADQTLEDFRKGMHSMESALKKVDEQVVGETNTKALEQALKDVAEVSASLKRTAASIETSSAKIGPLLDKLDPVATNVNKASVTLDDTLKTFKAGADNFSSLTRTMAKGEGLFPALFTDARLREDFKQLISNLKRNGVIFYRDNAEKAKAEEEAKRRAPARR